MLIYSFSDHLSLLNFQGSLRPSITDEKFRFVSIITAKNAQKDEINRLGCEMFAQHTGQKLVDFNSKNSLKPLEDLEKGRRPRKAKKTLAKLNAAQQNILWNLVSKYCLLRASGLNGIYRGGITWQIGWKTEGLSVNYCPLATVIYSPYNTFHHPEIDHSHSAHPIVMYNIEPRICRLHFHVMYYCKENCFFLFSL